MTPHVLRHTPITKLVQAGVDLPTIQRISAHKTMAMVLRYSHVSGPHIDAAIGDARRLRDYTKITPRLAAASRQYTANR